MVDFSYKVMILSKVKVSLPDEMKSESSIKKLNPALCKNLIQFCGRFFMQKVEENQFFELKV